MPPNLLFILADQLAASALPFYGNHVAQTPHLARLAERGVVFESAYCNSPLCAPSRASLMTGQLPARIGAYDNAAQFGADVPTFAHYLRGLGYQTCLSGKMHFVGPDQLHGFEQRLTTDIYPADFGWTPNWEQPDTRLSWYHNMLSVVQAGVVTATNQIDFDDEVAFHATRHLFDMARSDDPRPFCLVASFTHPHDPYAITREYWERYDHAAIDMPAVGPLAEAQLDPHSRRLRRMCAMEQYALTDERTRNARHAYYAMLSYVDDKVGALLAALEASGYADNTIVIVASDHGDMLGERGLWYKMSFFEASARVPLVVHEPGRYSPRRVSQPVSLVDLLPTLVELGGGGPGHLVAPVDGVSLAPLLRGDAAGGPEAVAGEYLAEGALAPIFMLRRGPYKFVYSPADPDQLYDLADDPHELTNLAADPAHAETRRAFRAEVLARWNPEAVNNAVLASQRRRRLVAEALSAGQRVPWDFQPHRAAAEQYMRGHLDLDTLERTARFPTQAPPPPDGPAA